MDFKWISEKILDEINSILSHVDEEKISQFVSAILSSERIFVTGLGRSGLVARSFAIRLMQLGLKVLIVGDITTPSIKNGDLLIAISGSGETPIVKHIVTKAKESDATIFIITAKAEGSMSKSCDCMLILPEVENRVLPLRSAFEASAYILLDATINMIMDKTGITQKEMMERHSNLE
jgi:6-phospho-3-hexuloisomerase